VFSKEADPDIPRIVAHLVVMPEKLDPLDILVLVSELQHVLRPPEHREFRKLTGAPSRMTQTGFELAWTRAGVTTP